MEARKTHRLPIIKGAALTLSCFALLGWLILVFQALFTWIKTDHLNHLQVFWSAVLAINHVMLQKLITLTSALPLFLFAIAAGLVDGLNQRAIRTACLGRESTYVFHKSLPVAQKIVTWVLGLWLCLPFEINATPLFIGLAVLLGFITQLCACRFKKYL